jgi:hypothetical protein
MAEFIFKIKVKYKVICRLIRPIELKESKNPKRLIRYLCDSGYLMREKITFCDFTFGRLIFFVAGSRIRNLSKPWPDCPDNVLPLRHCAAI